MLTYIAAFIFYTLAMIGVLLLGFVVYKKFFYEMKSNSKGMIKVIDRCAIAPKKSLMVVKIKKEMFLIALDCDRTTFLSKLSSDSQAKKEFDSQEEKSEAEVIKEQKKVKAISDQFKKLYSSSVENDFEAQEEEKKPTRKEMVRKLLKELNESNYSTGSY